MRVAVLALLLLAGCATGRADWRWESYQTDVRLRSAGDQRCSDPAPYESFRACLLHDAAYELARRVRCDEREDLLGLASEQARLAADLTLAQQMALDGYPEWWTAIYFVGVRLGGWWTWHFEACD